MEWSDERLNKLGRLVWLNPDPSVDSRAKVGEVMMV